MDDKNFISTLNVVNDINNLHIIVGIPAFNEEKNIASVIEKAKSYASEVMVYDDGSIDKTSEIAKKEGAFVIRNPKNKGYGIAIKNILNNAFAKGADIVITMDSDGQHDATQIPRLINPIIKGEADIVIGSRFLNKEDKEKVPIYRMFGIKAITKMTQMICYNNITDAQSGFRAYSKNALSKLHLVEQGMAISTEILLKAKENDLIIVEVPVTITYQVEDSSTHNPLSHGIGVLSHLLQHLSFKHPLLFYGLPGLILLIFSAYFTYIALELFSTTRYISTNLILISIGLSLIGIICLATGAIVYTLIALFKGNVK